MSALLESIVFLNPWVLVALAALPGLWFLLRVLPPAPRVVKFPATVFLEGLIPNKQTASKTPWWILLLRLLILALVILGLADPISNMSSTLSGTGNLRLIIDNSWIAAHSWDAQMDEADKILNQAERDKRAIYLRTTTASGETQTVLSEGPISSAKAKALLKTLEPLPWSPENQSPREIDKVQAENIWLGHGINENGTKKLLSEFSSLKYIGPNSKNSSVFLKQGPLTDKKNGLSIRVQKFKNSSENKPVLLNVLNTDGKVLEKKSVLLAPDKLYQDVDFDIPQALLKGVSAIRVVGGKGAGSLYLLDESTQKRSVSIITPNQDSQPIPFIEDVYYLQRAIEPFAEVHVEAIEDSLKRKPSVIILSDIASMPMESVNAIDNWVKDGGLLLRFAGPNMSEAMGQIFLTPSPLKNGLRSTDGSLSWDKPPTVEAFADKSPLFGITVGENIEVRQQILPVTGILSDDQIWARLDDGTPFITGAFSGKGLYVMVHATASVNWSNFALSGTYVEVLKRLISMGWPSGNRNIEAYQSYKPYKIMNGFGDLETPDDWAEAIPNETFEEVKPSFLNPPGLYKISGQYKALNIGDYFSSPHRVKLPVGVSSQFYSHDNEVRYKPYLLCAALIGFLIDWVIMLALTGGIIRSFKKAMLFVLVTLSATGHVALAKDAKHYAEGLYLAYVQTQDRQVDEISRAGLENLAKALTMRTSAEPKGVIAVNPETDVLAFFPLIYWPISPNAEALSDKALKNVQAYIDNGGTIFFDTREKSSGDLYGYQSENTAKLQQITRFLNIPPLEKIDDQHVLGKSFYLLDRFVGAYAGGTVWVENTSANNQRDGVSPVIINSNDLARGLSDMAYGQSFNQTRTPQQELTIRFGINLVMYALTGNYKADQVHVQHILERLSE